MSSAKAFLLVIVTPCLLLICCPSSSSSSKFDILDLGADPNAQRDSTSALLAAWSAACRSQGITSIHVPRGEFLVGHLLLAGPCKSDEIVVQLNGTLVAPSDYTKLDREWIVLDGVQHVKIQGGTLDGQGSLLWACKASHRGQRCPFGAASLRLRKSNDVLISGLTSVNSKLYHITINECNGVAVRGVNISAPQSSPNTDGVHVEASSYVSVSNTHIATGDDCISIGPGAEHLWIEGVGCGPGHGISIGSLGKEYKEDGVHNITVVSTNFTSSENGFRIKTWGRPSTGFVRDVKFNHAVMKDVHKPIIITQDYCPHGEDCPGMNSSVEISNVTYLEIRGTSADPVAVSLDCSPTTPCREISLVDVNLTYDGDKAKTHGNNVVPPIRVDDDGDIDQP